MPNTWKKKNTQNRPGDFTQNSKSEKFVSLQTYSEMYKQNTTKEISGLKFLMKLFQNPKLESELNDFQITLIVSSHLPFLNKEMEGGGGGGGG